MRTRAAIVCSATIAAAATGCASGQRIGKGATSGAISEIAEETRRLEQQREQMPFERVAGNAVKGALSELDRPERRAELGRVIDTAVGSMLQAAGASASGAEAWGGGPPPAARSSVGALGDQFSTGLAQGFGRQLRLELGESGNGELARSVSGLVERASGAAVSGAMNRMSTADLGVASTGLDQRVYDLSRSAASGFSDGIARSLRIPMLAAAFAFGLATGLVLVAVLRSLGFTAPRG